jgi:haloalkane dehalogenase
MHYVDEGSGPAVVLVHGTPVWSFLYRDLIRNLSADHRCIAMDHIGFGLSDKPRGWGYRPQDHARNLATLLDHLDLRDVSLIVHDFGGPIGLSYALEHPERIRNLTIFNTWMWSLRGNRNAHQIDRLMGGWFGDLFYLRLNGSARFLIPAVYGDRTKLPRAVHEHYIRAAPKPEDRRGMLTLARLLVGQSDWYEGLWERRARLRDIPTLLLWGLRDPGVRGGVFDLARFEGMFRESRSVTFPDAGHFVQEEEAGAVIPLVREHLAARRATFV